MEVRNCRNVKFNGQFVLKNLDVLRKKYKFGQGVLTLIKIAKRDGLKCDTCQNDNIHFEIAPKMGMIMLAGSVRMTKDHDLLNSLEGSDGADNQHLLCKTCNSLRGNRFAQYKEFKDWYDSVLASGRDPFKVISKVKRNFSYTDFTKNGYTVDDLPFEREEIPHIIKNGLTENFLKHQAFKVTSEMFLPSTLLTLSEKAWDNYLNELIVILVKERINKDVELRSTYFHVYGTKKCKTSLESLFDRVNSLIIKEYAKVKKIAYCGEFKAPVKKVQKVPEQSFEVISIRPNFLQRLKTAFQVLIAA